jgi:hypothetical protein
MRDKELPTKAGLKSTAKKLNASRPDFGAKPGSKPVPGAHGDPGKDKKSSANRLYDDSPVPAEKDDDA